MSVESYATPPGPLPRGLRQQEAQGTGCWEGDTDKKVPRKRQEGARVAPVGSCLWYFTWAETVPIGGELCSYAPAVRAAPALAGVLVKKNLSSSTPAGSLHDTVHTSKGAP